MRPAVLIVDLDAERRKALATGLAERGYEAIPAASPEEGVRFAEGLGPSVIVGPAGMPSFADGSILERFSVQDGSQMQRTLVLLGTGDELLDADDLPDSVRYLPIDGLDTDEIRRRIRLVLVAREVGLETDLELRYLVGDVALVPLLDLVRSLHRCWITGRIEVPRGIIAFQRGEPIAARYERTVGAKAFCRMARLEATPFRVYLGPSEETPNLHESIDDLSIRALEELDLELPDPRTRVRLVALREIPSGELMPVERLLADVIHRCDTISDVLDQVPATDALVLQAIRKMVARGALELERPKTGVKIVTDSTADLPPELAREHDILTVPLTVYFGKESYRDGVDIKPRDFYRLLQESEHHPRTEPPPEEVFYEHYHELIEEQDILSVHISSKLSLTSENAQKAVLRGIRTFDHLPAERHDCALEVVDSRSVSMGVGLQALFAARMAMRGEKVFAIAQRLRAISGRLHLLFAVDSLDYLLKGGRIGKARAVVGKLLGIKPILGVEDGEVVAVDKVRGGRRLHPRIVHLVRERIDPARPIIVCIAHAQAPVWADRLRKLIEKTFSIHEIFLADIGPVVGTHAGPGCVGIVVFQPSDEEWALVRPADKRRANGG